MTVLEEKSGQHQSHSWLLVLGPWMCAQNVMVIRPIVVEIFFSLDQSGGLTDRPSMPLCRLRKNQIISCTCFTCYMATLQSFTHAEIQSELPLQPSEASASISALEKQVATDWSSSHSAWRVYFLLLPSSSHWYAAASLSERASVCVCVCASISACTWCFVLGPINTEHSFLSARRLRQNNNRMLSKEKPFSLFPNRISHHHFLPPFRGPTVSSRFECLEKYQAGISHSHLASLKGLLSGFNISPPLCLCCYPLAFDAENKPFLLKQLCDAIKSGQV